MTINKLFLLMLCISLNNTTFAVEFLETRTEKNDKAIGSLLGESAITFKFGHNKTLNHTIINTDNINTYLYQATLDYFHFVRLSIEKNDTCTMTSDWYTPKDEPNTQFKFKILLNGKIINDDAIKIIVYQKQKSSNQWLKEEKNNALSNDIKQIIINKARTLYISETSETKFQ